MARKATDPMNVLQEQRYRPGMRVPHSGRYLVCGPDGHSLNRTIKGREGKRFPPLPDGGCYADAPEQSSQDAD